VGFEGLCLVFLVMYLFLAETSSAPPDSNHHPPSPVVLLGTVAAYVPPLILAQHLDHVRHGASPIGLLVDVRYCLGENFERVDGGRAKLLLIPSSSLITKDATGAR